MCSACIFSVKRTFAVLSLSVSLFAQSVGKELADVSPKDSVVRASFVQTKQMKSLDKPLVSEGNILSVRNRGVVWTMQSPTFVRKVMTFGENNPSASYYAMFEAFFNDDFSSLQRRFECFFAKDADNWTVTLVPKSAAIKKHFKSVVVKGSTDGKFQDVRIFSADDSGVDISFTREIPTNQFLSEDEEALFKN